MKRAIPDSGANGAAVEIFTAVAAASASRTVTLSSSAGGDIVALKVLAITGVDLDAPIGSVGEGSSSTANLTVTAYTSTAIGSRAVGIASDEESDSSPTSSDTGFPWAVSFVYSGIAVHKASNTSSAGTSVTLNFNGTGDSRAWNWAALEVLPRPETPRAVTLRPTSAVHRAASW
ncbi:hypothetical protein ACQEUU_37505 [Nonomuraea sp. CA-218870]|uniref:hypothetical protein n=1 Tax=Nonomuraea sp. CA-218870 TaxID=3239998 RepID=UPI003D929F43